MTSTSAAGQVQGFLCRPLESDPEYLGGAPTRPKYLIDNLCRSATLPPKKFKIKNKEAKREFLRIYNGDFIARWSSSQDSFDLWVESTDYNAPPELKGAIIHTKLRKTMVGEAMFSGGGSSMFSNAVSTEDMQILACRANHHFLRQNGSRLPTDLFVLTCYTLAKELVHLIRQEEAPRIIEEAPRIEEAQELSVLLIDGLSTLEVSEETNLHLLKMGESLEVIGEFVEAAKVYERLLQPGEKGRGPSRGESAALCAYAALSYKRATMFDMAEEYFLRAFQELFEESHNTQLRLNDFGGFIKHLMGMYVDRRLSQPERMASQGPGNAEALTELVLLGLLYQVGYKDPDPCMNMMIQDLGSQALQGFKDEFKTKRAAHKALYHAFTRPTLAEYRSYLKSCLAFGQAALAIDFIGGPSVPDKDYTSDTFKHAFGEINEIKGFIACSGCGKMECADISSGRFMKCPCACVYYCEKKCQRNHWPRHKLMCSYYQKTKKK
jgi:tetratricopeptide (TPR) repeat protein